MTNSFKGKNEFICRSPINHSHLIRNAIRDTRHRSDRRVTEKSAGVVSGAQLIAPAKRANATFVRDTSGNALQPRAHSVVASTTDTGTGSLCLPDVLKPETSVRVYFAFCPLMRRPLLLTSWRHSDTCLYPVSVHSCNDSCTAHAYDEKVSDFWHENCTRIE